MWTKCTERGGSERTACHDHSISSRKVFPVRVAGGHFRKPSELQLNQTLGTLIQVRCVEKMWIIGDPKTLQVCKGCLDPKRSKRIHHVMTGVRSEGSSFECGE